jgi:hypothetical protein
MDGNLNWISQVAICQKNQERNLVDPNKDLIISGLLWPKTGGIRPSFESSRHQEPGFSS